MGDASVTYSLKYQIRLLQYDADNEQLVCKRAMSHPAEVWDIAPCPRRDDLMVTVWAKGEQGPARRCRGAASQDCGLRLVQGSPRAARDLRSLQPSFQPHSLDLPACPPSRL
ncbi:hypothetical protein TSOC_007629 [Tetrabaena socialis]|uniref:Uncharacterized protein n=1 Tax=Tetrabaena socialis TaxID=47790 RepID=A0A2J8A0M6_9CHLO|nr:hypothetical protein TSOC_007629 [Tetrabaena socialis]|eukprot:PNH06055.1 hypothetical protein TSOC_007629 [Tetrabaena socialis]